MRTNSFAKVRFAWGLPILIATLGALANAGTPTVTTFAGGYLGDGKDATEASLAYPASVVTDAKGDIYIGDTEHCRVRKVNSHGVISTFAGTGICGYGGDGGPALAAMVSSVAGMTFDGKGNLLLADQANERIRAISPAGIITTIAGNGTFGYSGDGGPATQASMNGPSSVSVDGAGNLYIADSANYVIRMVDTAGNIHTVAGNHTFGFSGDGGPATSAQLSYIPGVVADQNGDFYIADIDNLRVRKVESGIITTYAGNGSSGNSGSGGLATSAGIGGPSALLLSFGDLYIGTAGNVWAVNQKTQIINLTAGDPNGEIGYGGDGGQAIYAQFTYLSGIASNNPGSLLLADSGNDRVRATIGSLQIVNTVAGGYLGDEGRATEASLNFYQPGHTTFDTEGNFYIADSFDNRVRKVSPTGEITTFAGTGITGSGGNGGLATAATLSAPRAVAADSSGNVYIADESGILREVDRSGIIDAFSTVDIFSSFDALAVDGSGNVYASDGLWAVWKIAPSGSGTIIAGVLYELGYNGDGIAATQAELYFPNGLAVDGAGNVYISDWLNCRIRKVNTSGIISTVAGTGVCGFGGDGGLATAALISLPQDVAVDNQGNLYLADWANERVRMVNDSGIIETIAGTGNYGYNGDGLPAKQTNLSPIGVTVHKTGVYVTDETSYRVRKVR
jgi:sugar lactone lactonase YvrE